MNVPISDAPRSPQRVGEYLAQYLAEGNAEGALSLFEAESIMFTLTGELVRGLDSIRESLKKSIALKATLKVDTATVLEADGIALVSRNWTVTGIQPDGEPLKVNGHGADVVRRQSDGSWRYLIDNPQGTEI